MKKLFFAIIVFITMSAQQLKPELAKCVSLRKGMEIRGDNKKIEVWFITWKLKRNNRTIEDKFYPKKPLQRPPYKKGNYYTIYINK